MRVVNATAPVAPAPAAAPTAEAGVGTLAKTAAAGAPVQADRVARIRKAVADGTFPILPAEIADRLIALKFDWARHD